MLIKIKTIRLTSASVTSIFVFVATKAWMIGSVAQQKFGKEKNFLDNVTDSLFQLYQHPLTLKFKVRIKLTTESVWVKICNNCIKFFCMLSIGIVSFVKDPKPFVSEFKVKLFFWLSKQVIHKTSCKLFLLIGHDFIFLILDRICRIAIWGKLWHLLLKIQSRLGSIICSARRNQRADKRL